MNATEETTAPAPSEMRAAGAVHARGRLTVFLLAVIAELRLVHWPDRRQVAAYTGVVAVFMLTAIVGIWLADAGTASLMMHLFS